MKLTKQVIVQKVTRFTKRVLIASAFLTIGAWIAYGATAWVYEMRPKPVQAERVVEVKATEAAPVLDRIAKCESGGSHYRNGQIVYNANSDGSVDVGKYQVNLRTWGKKATELGLDLTKEEDNKKMAEWIYLNRGTVDWEASRKCWNG